MNKKTVLIYSGGMDSTTLLYKLLQDKYNVYLLTFDYNQKHKKEIQAAKETIKFLKTSNLAQNIIEHNVIDISSINALVNASSLTSNNFEVPEGHYADENMKLTVVPNRNMIFLSIAIGYAVNVQAGSVCYAAHSGDHAIYPDCRPDFVEKMKNVAKIANYQSIDILTPFISLTKGEILEIGLSLKLPVDYSKTWTCYKGKEKACGKCGACVERLEAFEFAKRKDPILYE